MEEFAKMQEQIAQYKSLTTPEEKQEGAKVIFVATRNALHHMKALSKQNEDFKEEVANGRNDFEGFYKDELLSKCKEAYNIVRSYAITFKEDFPREFNKAADSTRQAYISCKQSAESTGALVL